MKIGKYTVDVFETGDFALDGGAMFGVAPKPLWSKAYHEGDEANRIAMTARCLLVRSDDRTILVDSGCGNKMSPKLCSIYALDNSIKSIEFSLKQFDLSPEDITDVILTHLHFDHAGGATVMKNNESIPTFPNARYYVQKKHYDWANSPSEKDRASFMTENWMPIVNAGMMEFTDGEGSIFDGIKVVPVHGHTAAMQMVTISDNSTTLVFPADLLPTSAHIPLPYIMGYDNFPLTTLEEKKMYLPRMADEGWLVVFEHDRFTVAGKVERTAKGFACGERLAEI